LKSKERAFNTCYSNKITDSFSTVAYSSLVRSLIILLIEGVIGCSSFAAKIALVVINKGRMSFRFYSCIKAKYRSNMLIESR